MSAAAVAAVRPGFRIEFSRASLPGRAADPHRGPAEHGGERSRRAGWRSRRRRRRGAGTPAPIEPSRWPDAELRREHPVDEQARPRATAARPRAGAKRAKRDGGSDAPSRTAAIGGTRVARRAGTKPATSVIATPATRLTTTVRAAKTVPVDREVEPERAQAPRSRPFASPSPSEEAGDGGGEPDHERLQDDGAEHLPAGGPDRPQGRELPHPLGDGDRQGVEDHERPDEERDPAEREQEVADELREVLDVLGRVRRLLRRRSAPRCRAAGAARSRPRAAPGETPSRGGHLDPVELARPSSNSAGPSRRRSRRTSRCRSSRPSRTWRSRRS